MDIEHTWKFERLSNNAISVDIFHFEKTYYYFVINKLNVDFMFVPQNINVIKIKSQEIVNIEKFKVHL